MKNALRGILWGSQGTKKKIDPPGAMTFLRMPHTPIPRGMRNLLRLHGAPLCYTILCTVYL